MQSCGWAKESLLSLTGLCHSVSQFKAFQDPQPLVSPPPQMLTSYCCGKFRMDGSGLTDTHFLLALDITRRTRLSLVQLEARNGNHWGESERKSFFPLSEPRSLRSRPPPSCGSGSAPCCPSTCTVPAYQCRALALQYLRSLSGSTTCPFLQH